MSKISANYQKALEGYLEWANVRTPFSNSFMEAKKPSPRITIAEDGEGITAAEALRLWESTGESSKVCPQEAHLLSLYIAGKSQRDWWSKEIGWMDKHAVYIPEEYLGFLGPLPFIELFGREPITLLVRYYHDNRYRSWEFWLDNFIQTKTIEWGMWYYERNDRHTSIQNAARVINVKWISPKIYKVKRYLRKLVLS